MNEFAKAHPELERDPEEFKNICIVYAAMKLAAEETK
jgi:hypothetical protein